MVTDVLLTGKTQKCEKTIMMRLPAGTRGPGVNEFFCSCSLELCLTSRKSRGEAKKGWYIKLEKVLGFLPGQVFGGLFCTVYIETVASVDGWQHCVSDVLWLGGCNSYPPTPDQISE